VTKTNTHSFLIEDAKKHGIPAACILYHLKYLQQTKVDKSHETHEGKHWVNYTYQSMSNTFPYLGIEQVRRIMKKLTDDGVVIKDHLSKQRFNRELYWHVPFVEIDGSDVSKSTDDHVSKSTDVLHPSNVKPLHTGEDIDSFETFWSAYPRKVNKKGAGDKFRALSPEEKLLAITDVLRRKKYDDTWTKENGKFIPHPTTYLNQRRWEDVQTTKTKNLGEFDYV
jgi:hypothetical protein